MMRSLFSGVSGLKTHQTKMDVIGNNIANVNTTAYKSSSITFSDLMSQTTARASGPNAATGTGGTNAKQIGLGVKSGAINTNIGTQGSSQSTGNPFDIMITGDAFFVVSNGAENFFTRDGSFYVDGAGNLAMTSTGYNVMGWQVDETTGMIKKDTVTALRIMSAANMTYPPEATSRAYVAGIIDKNDTDVTSANGKTMNLNFYDALGYSYTARLTLRQSDEENLYSVELTGLLDSQGNMVEGWEKISITGAEDQSGLPTQKLSTSIKMQDGYAWETTNGNDKVLTQGGQVVATLTDAEGISDADWDVIAKAYSYEGSTRDFKNLYIEYPDNNNGTIPYSIQTLVENFRDGETENIEKVTTDASANGGDGTISIDGRFYDGAMITFDPDTGTFAGINGAPTVNTITIDFSQIGRGEMENPDPNGDPIPIPADNFSTVQIDFSECSMFDNKGTSTVAATSGDTDGVGTGRTLGDMIGVSIQNNGMIYASYDNGMTKLLGQMATAEFANASGLEKQGDNLYSATLNSGEFDGIGVDVTASGGYMSTGVLEMSNVDLSSEFTEMITTQRGFQANSRIITVSDTLLEELTNLKR